MEWISPMTEKDDEDAREFVKRISARFQNPFSSIQESIFEAYQQGFYAGRKACLDEGILLRVKTEEGKK